MPDAAPLLSLLRSAARHQKPGHGQQLHSRLIKTGLHHSPPFPNTLLNLYAKCGLLQDAHRLFDETPHRDPVIWSSLLAAYSQSDSPRSVLSLFPHMTQIDGIHPDDFIFATLVKTSARLRSARLGRQVHARFLSSFFNSDDVVRSALVDMYSKSGAVDDARRVFDTVAVKNPVSLTAMISGYASNGRNFDAIDLFRRMGVKKLLTWTALISGLVQGGDNLNAVYLFVEMRREGVEIDDSFVLSTVIGGASNLAAHELGKQLHGLMVILGYELSMIVGNALVDMYAKCSDILSARDAFENISKRDIVSWTTMIVGEAQHGRAEEALNLFDEMIGAGVKPNEVTFIGLIYACSHSGLVEKGRRIFNSMIDDYGIRPSLQHYTCLLDLLSRSGFLSEAEDVIREMPFVPDEATWGALLSACKKHGDVEMSIRVADHLLSLIPGDPSTYILLSNVYAINGRWDCVANLRKMMAAMEVRKEPGYSWVEVGKESHLFLAGEVPHHMRYEIHGVLAELGVNMRKRGYTPDTSSVLHDMDEQEKEEQLFLHSERLAVAFGLLKAVPGVTIRVVKNLRVCGDCHTVMKLVSSIFEREVVVRDANRFHHFKAGECSCDDFW